MMCQEPRPGRGACDDDAFAGAKSSMAFESMFIVESFERVWYYQGLCEAEPL